METKCEQNAYGSLLTTYKFTRFFLLVFAVLHIEALHKLLPDTGVVTQEESDPAKGKAAVRMAVGILLCAERKKSRLLYGKRRQQNDEAGDVCVFFFYKITTITAFFVCI